MATRTQIVMVCDLCNTEQSAGGEGIRPHSITVDKRAMDFDACLTCWERIENVLPKPRRGRRKAASLQAV